MQNPISVEGHAVGAVFDLHNQIFLEDGNEVVMCHRLYDFIGRDFRGREGDDHRKPRALPPCPEGLTEGLKLLRFLAREGQVPLEVAEVPVGGVADRPLLVDLQDRLAHEEASPVIRTPGQAKKALMRDAA